MKSANCHQVPFFLGSWPLVFWFPGAPVPPFSFSVSLPSEAVEVNVRHSHSEAGVQTPQRHTPASMPQCCSPERPGGLWQGVKASAAADPPVIATGIPAGLTQGPGAGPCLKGKGCVPWRRQEWEAGTTDLSVHRLHMGKWPTARSVSLSWGAREVGSPCEWRGGARHCSRAMGGDSGLETC